MGKNLEAAIGALNGLVGDYLARSGNGLATEMDLFTATRGSVPVHIDAIDGPVRVIVLMHGLMCSESIWEDAEGRDYGSRLAEDLGWLPLYGRYNTGLSIPENGALLAALLERTIARAKGRVSEIVLMGYSMGGLVTRSACHFATVEGHAWLGLVKRAVYIGTPHRGAPLERFGRLVSRTIKRVPDPYAELAHTLAELRSDGVKDLGDADLTHAHRTREGGRVGLAEAEHPVPLLPSIDHYLVAGSVSESRWLTTFFGDVIVPLTSATNGVLDPSAMGADGPRLLAPSRVKLIQGLGHVALAHDAGVYKILRAWFEEWV